MRIGLVLTFFSILCVHSVVNAQIASNGSNYVVIGAFAIEKNASHCVTRARGQHYDATFQLNEARNLYYVYVLNTSDRQEAMQRASRLRQETKYRDAWVFSGALGVAGEQAGTDLQPVTGENLTTIEPKDQEVTHDEVKTEEPAQEPSNNTTVEDTPDGKKFKFKLFANGSGEPLEGEVNLINVENNKVITTYKGNEDVFVKQINKSGDVAFESQVFGYRKLKHLVNINSPEASDGISIENGEAIVPFEFVRLQRGDVAIMYNVFFFKDAAIMRPESKAEITSLVQMMKEHPTMEIRIHGHTNGSAAGKIIEMGDSKNFFSLTGSRDGRGSAKKLSEARAKIIQDYLISEGIDASRTQVKAWGGKKPIYDKNHAQAQANVRVEIEVTKD